MFSDLPDLAAAEAELWAWARATMPRDIRLQERGTRRQHFDLWGRWLALCGPHADRAAMRRWLRGEPTPHEGIP